MRSLVSWNVTQHKHVVSYWRFGTNYQFHLQGSTSWTAWPLKIGLIDCPETSVTNYQSALHNNPKQRRSHLSLLTHEISKKKNQRNINLVHSNFSCKWEIDNKMHIKTLNYNKSTFHITRALKRFLRVYLEVVTVMYR